MRLLLICLSLAGLASADPLALTPLGRLRGRQLVSRAGRAFLAFSGVPYAKPPVGQLRFQPPQPLDPWKGVKNAQEDGPWCVQYNPNDFDPPRTLGEEDCLYLSVYTHNLTGRAPVLVHFHGGGFTAGNGARKTGPQYLMDEDLVFVDVNYRLSMLGFLSFEDLEMPGNQGMKDQVMALKWIQQNIASLGGDPNRVTLVGESAGGASVYHHTVSPLSRGLFHGGIAESGTSYTAFALPYPGGARNTSMWLLSLVGCPYTSTREAVACLRTKDAKQLVETIAKMLGWQDEARAFFIPCLEPPHPGAFLVGPIKDWKHAPVPLIIGTTSGEGLLKSLYMEYVNASYEWYYNHLEEVGPESLQVYGYSSEPVKVVRALRQYYFPNGQITDKEYANFTMVYSDSICTIGSIDGANKHQGNVYFYYFDYLGYYSLAGNADTRNSSTYIGAFHTDEIIYLFYNKDYANLQGNDLMMSKNLVKMWANFAACGNPSTSKITWDRWSPQTFNYLNIDEHGYHMKENFARDRYRFWKNLKYRDNMK